jgi:hypothetical protein
MSVVGQKPHVPAKRQAVRQLKTCIYSTVWSDYLELNTATTLNLKYSPASRHAAGFCIGRSLEPQKKPSDLVGADESAADDQQSPVIIGRPLAMDSEAAKAGEPCQCPLHNPAVLPSLSPLSMHRPVLWGRTLRLRSLGWSDA